MHKSDDTCRWCQAAITDALTPLKFLPALRLHLDSRDALHPLAADGAARRPYENYTLADVAATFARLLAPVSSLTLEAIALLRVFTHDRSIAPHIVRDREEEGGAGVGLKMVDGEAEALCGTS